MRALTQFLLPILLNASWQILLVVMFASLCAWLLRGTAAWHRHAVWVAALALSIALPILSSSKWSNDSSPARTQPNTVRAESPTRPTIVGTTELPENDAIETVAPPNPTSPLAQVAQRASIAPIRLDEKLAQGLVLFYALFVFYRGVKLFQAWRRTRAIVRTAYSLALPEPLQTILNKCQSTLGVRRFRILFSASVAVPITAGVFTPLIILPEQLLREDDRDILSSALGHELVHVARRDYILNLVYELIYLPLSFHPAAALLRRRVRQTRELCCDELVATKLVRPEIYARSLVRLIAAAPLAGRLTADTTIGITDADILEVRIMSLLKRSKLSARRRALLLIAASLLLATPCLAAASFGFEFDFEPQDSYTAPQQARADATGQLQRAREELKRKEQELKERVRNNPNLQGAELEAVRRIERELQTAATKLRQEEEALQSGGERDKARQKIKEYLAQIETKYPADEGQMRTAKEKLAELEKLYTKDRIREVQETIAQMEKNRPANEARMREALEKLALIDKLYQQNSRARMINRVEPVYSEDARDNKVEGVVLLEVTVDPNGMPQDIRVTKPLYPSLDANAVEALRQSRFEPSRENGQPTAKRITVEMRFDLENGRLNSEREAREKRGTDQSESYPREMRMRRDREDSAREERSRKQVELTKGANISMDRALQVATSQYPGKVLACSLGRDSEGRVIYHVVIITSEGEKNITRYVWVSALDGQILKTEKEDR